MSVAKKQSGPLDVFLMARDQILVSVLELNGPNQMLEEGFKLLNTEQESALLAQNESQASSER